MENVERRRFALPITPVLLSAFVVCAAQLAVPGLTTVTGQAAPGAELALSSWYVAFAPACDFLDMLSMFSQRQHFAFLLTCAIAYVMWRRLCRQEPAPSRAFAVGKEIVMAVTAFLVIAALYAGGILLPRPIPELRMLSADAVVVDFHSHTSFSWDGRRGFSPEENRRWHSASGFDVAYVTDHGTFAGAEKAAAHNPALAGEGTVMLSGIEVRSGGRHLNILGTSASDSAAFVGGDLLAGPFRRLIATKAVRPVVLLTLPGKVDDAKSGIPIDALELSDAAPRALGQIDQQKRALFSDVERDHLAMVAGSNNHGWASASPAWSVMQIPGWRSMTPAELDVAIRRTIIRGGMKSVSIVERRKSASTSAYALAWTVPLAVWEMLTRASSRERVSWVLWIWGGYFAACGVRSLASRRRIEATGGRGLPLLAVTTVNN